jgi:uncharacterized protein (TIGR02284 family)
MDNQTLCDKLNDLLQLEFDAAHAYITAIKNAESEDIQDQFLEFLTDHNHHVARLSERIKSAGGTPAARPDLKGKFIKGMTAVMSKLGDHNALRVMNQNEALTNRSYDKAVEEPYPADVLAMLREFQSDEHRHKAWIEQQLAAYKEERPAQAPSEQRPSQP